MKPDPHKSLRYIRKLILSGEGQQLDFKFEISDAKKIARTLSAFSNTTGGKLLIGVKDNGKISGIQSDEEAYMVETAARIYCHPEVSFRIKKWFVEGKWVLEVEIPQSTLRPHYAQDEKGKWIAYMRVGDQNMQADRVMVSVWKNTSKKRSAFLSYNKEEKALVDYLEDHDEISFSKFLKIARISPEQAEHILVNLILMDVIEMNATGQPVSFKRKTGP
ncbi:MAG: putative DNA binding domain-containing protein [Bacteroidales bacterium]|nr:putative DNA binding domain-containing protein [Bacteroidales bacterium]